MKFEKVNLNNVAMIVFSVPEADWNEGNDGQLCWALPVYKPTIIYQINTSFIADNEELGMESKYKLNTIDDDKLKEWLKGIDLNAAPFKSMGGVETVSESGNYFVVEFKLKKDESN